MKSRCAPDGWHKVHRFYVYTVYGVVVCATDLDSMRSYTPYIHDYHTNTLRSATCELSLDAFRKRFERGTVHLL